MKPIPTIPTIDTLKKMEMIRRTNGKFFTIKVPTNKGIRKFVCRLKVKKYLVGGEPSYNREERSHICVWEEKSHYNDRLKGRGKGYRTLNVPESFDFKCGKDKF